MRDSNPFIYSRPLSPEGIIDRDGEVEELLGHALGGHYVRLYAPRKFGKTSLLKRVLRDGQRDGLVPILVDLYGITSITDVTIRFERAYSRQLKGAVRARVDKFLLQTGIGLSLGAYGISARLQLDARFDPLPALHELLDLPLRLDERGRYRAFIALDEFQDVGRVPELDALLRSHIQYQGEVASYVFAGSEPGLMEQLFEDKDRPLYGSAVPVRLGRLADADIATYVVDRFAQTKREVGDPINALLASAQGHPQRAMLLAHRLWAETRKGKTATLDEWDAAHAGALAELHPEFDARWRGLDSSGQKTLRAIISSGGSPYRGEVRTRVNLTKDMLRRALPRLLATAEIETDEGSYKVVDPLFAEWITSLGRGSPESELGLGGPEE